MQIEKPLRQSSKWLNGWMAAENLHTIIDTHLRQPFPIITGDLFGKYLCKIRAQVFNLVRRRRRTFAKLFDMQKIERQNFADKQLGARRHTARIHSFTHTWYNRTMPSVGSTWGDCQDNARTLAAQRQIHFQGELQSQRETHLFSQTFALPTPSVAFKYLGKHNGGQVEREIFQRPLIGNGNNSAFWTIQTKEPSTGWKCGTIEPLPG